MNTTTDTPEHLSHPNVIALQNAIRDRDPLWSGTCTVPDYQRIFYYSHGDILRRIDFSNVKEDDLEALYQACVPAEFGLNGENVFDETYRKARKLELSSFATQFDPRSLGIHEEVSKALLTENRTGVMEMELYKLNVYGKGDFFKPHQDTPRGVHMFGSLVVVLPTQHEGGQLVLRQEGKEWTIDFTDKFASATEPTVCCVAFFGDVEHEVLPVTSGYRLTLTYNLYHKPSHPSTSYIPTAYHQNLKKALVDVLNDKSKLPNGGYLGFGLLHGYIYSANEPLGSLVDQLKGVDRAFANTCDELGIPYSIKLLYRGITEPRVHLITTKAITVNYRLHDESREYLRKSIQGFTTDELEGIDIIGTQCAWKPGWEWFRAERYKFLKKFYKEPITEVLEMTPMKSSVSVTSSFMAYGNQATLEHFYGRACMFIALEPAETRETIQL